MDDSWERQQKIEQDMQLVRREMERKSLDTIRIHNPLDIPFRYKWGGYSFSVPAKGYDDVERYRANIYARKIIQYMIGQDGLKKGEELMKLREKQLGKTFLDKYEENKEVWDRVPRLNDPELVKEYGQMVIIGLVREYGLEDIPEAIAPPERQETPYDGINKLMDRKILEEDNA